MQRSDIELGGIGYMLAPGSYKRKQEGLPEGRPGRIVVKDFFGGQRRAFQLERDRSFDGVGVGPVIDGQGVEPWPAESSHADGILADLPTTTVRAHSTVVGNQVFIGVGPRLYKTVALGPGAWANLTLATNLGAGVVITGLANSDGKVYIATGTGLDLKAHTPGGATVSVNAGDEADQVIGYAGEVLWSDANKRHVLKFTVERYDAVQTIRAYKLDSPIVRLALMGAKVTIVTRSSLYQLAGVGFEGVADDPAIAGSQSQPTRWTAEPVPVFSHGIWAHDEDFAFLIAFGGKLYTWLANQVMEWDPSVTRDRWRSVGPQGVTCFGACVSGGYLLVALADRRGRSVVWACDGSSWWRIADDAPATVNHLWPVALFGAGDRDALVFREGSATYDLLRLVYRSSSLSSYRASGSWVSSMLDAGHRDKPKAWAKVGASFATPEARGNSASVDPVTITLDYSIDGGATWVQAATSSPANAAVRTHELTAELGATVSRFIQLRVSWSSVADWAPVLVGVWVDFELLDLPARRRRWSFKVHARDSTVVRDGSLEVRSGRQVAADLWDAWETGAILPFRDVDYDAVPVGRSVRLTGINEEIPKPADAAQWGESIVDLTLVEV